jgi:hypothetical protein
LKGDSKYSADIKGEADCSTAPRYVSAACGACSLAQAADSIVASIVCGATLHMMELQTASRVLWNLIRKVTDCLPGPLESHQKGDRKKRLGKIFVL